MCIRDSAVKQRTEPSGRGDAEEESDDDADARDGGGLTQDQAQETSRPGTERDSNTEFLLTPADGVGDGGEKTDHRQGHPKTAQHADAGGGLTLFPQRAADP